MLERNEILEYPYTGTITRVIQGKGSSKDTEVILYEGVMDEHMVTDEEGRTLQTSSYIVSIPLTKDDEGLWIVPRKGDKISLTRYGETFKLTVDNAEPSQLGGVSIYASRNSWLRMGRTRILGFNADRMKKQMLSIAVDEQNKRLVDFAKEQINVIGEAIQQHNSRNHMDATGNLLDSLCWGVLYNGKYVDKGFYREKTATESAYMHQWWKGGFVTKWKEGKSLGWDRANWEDLPEIQGHEMADRFMSRQEGKGEGWKVFFAILAPYWGYWEKGFNMKSRRGSQNYIQFSVMTQFYDHVKPELKPMRVSFRVTQAIRYTQTSLMKSAKRGVYSGRRRFMLYNIMLNDSRISIYRYVENILTSVTENVYLMNEPQELTQSDTEDGFIVIRVGDLMDASEFDGSAYGYARVFVECYVPPITRGRLDVEKYTEFEEDINAAIKLATESDNDGTYWIQPDSFISADMGEDSNANNAYYMFVKSFVVMIDEEQSE